MKRLPWITLAVGAWMIGSPAFFGYAGSTVPAVNHMGFGVLLMISSWWMLIVGTTAGGWFQLLCGTWLILSHVVLGALLIASSWWAFLLGANDAVWFQLPGGARPAPPLLVEGCTAVASAMASDLAAGIVVVVVGLAETQSFDEPLATT